mgnify:CR=1 FL=1
MAAFGSSLSRRKFLLLSGSVVSLPLLAACSSTPSAPPAGTPAPTAAGTQPQVPKRGGSLVSAWTWTYPTLDPHLSTMAGNLHGFEAIFNSLVRFELVNAETWEHKVVGDLAESWEQPDLQTVVFKLKQGIKFHDGSDLTAEVAAWNLLRTRDHPKAYLKAQMAIVDSATAKDKHTLEVKLKAPNAGFIRSLAFPGTNVPIASKAAFDKNGEEWMQRNAVGTGPFKFKQWVTDDRLIMERNPEYHENGADGKPLPYLDEFVSRYIPDATVSLTDMRAGTVHVLQALLAKDVASVKADPNMVVVEQPWAGEVWFFGGFNVDKPPFNDVRVRQAALYGIDREGMAAALGFGIGVPYYYGEWARGAPGYDESIKKYEYNPAKVKELLAEAGYPNGIEIELKVIAREPENTIGEFVQQMWTNVGIKTRLVAQERLSWIDAVRAKNFDTCFWRGGFSYTSVDPDTAVTRITCGSPGNWAQWCDADVDRLMKEGAAVADPAQRHEIYKRVLTILQEKAYLYSGINVPMVQAYRKEVKGLFYNFSLPDVRAAWLDT